MKIMLVEPTISFDSNEIVSTTTGDNDREENASCSSAAKNLSLRGKGRPMSPASSLTPKGGVAWLAHCHLDEFPEPGGDLPRVIVRENTMTVMAAAHFHLGQFAKE